MTGSLASVHPELIPEWSEKNLPLTPDKITFGSNKRVWWKGACGHEWETSVKARSKGEKCPICSGARVIEGINDLATLKPLLAQEWSKKNKLKPTEVSVASHKKIIWKCKHGHEWEASVKSRTVNGTGCPYCSHNKVLAGFNDLASQYPEHSSDEGGITVIKVDKPNMAQKGTVSIEKTGEVFSGVNISGEENADVIYQPVYEVKGLAGAVYEITAAEDIITPDGTLRYAKGEVVDTVTTDENGLAKSKVIYLGRYTVVEITAPEGMVINKEAHEVELTYAGQEVAVTETATSFVNERQKVTVSLEKTIEKNDIFNIGNGDEMKNISFGLFAAEELVSASGTCFRPDNEELG